MRRIHGTQEVCVSNDDLRVFAGALDIAIETIGGYIDSEMPHGRKMTAKERKEIGALKESRAVYKRKLLRVTRIMKVIAA